MKAHSLRAFMERAETAGEAGEAIKFTASSPGIKRDGKDLDIGQWNLENYQRNPVFLWAHDYMGRNLPIGRSTVRPEGKRLTAEVLFDQADEFARQVEDKYRRGFLNAVSVGWLDEVRCKHCGEKLDFWQSWGLEILRKKCPHCEKELREQDVEVRYELLDISGVPVPGDPDALMEREYRALKDHFESRDTRGESGDQATRQSGNQGVEGSGDSEGDWLETAARMAQLFLRPGPDDDETRLRKYRGLIPAYRRAGKEAPEFRTTEELEALGEELVRGLFLEGEEKIHRGDTELAEKNEEVEREYLEALRLRLMLG